MSKGLIKVSESKVLSHMDENGKLIQYQLGDQFVIQTRNYSNKRITIKGFRAINIEKALEFFYDLSLPQTSRKYFVRYDHLSMIPEDIYEMKGTIDKTTMKILRAAKSPKKFKSISKVLLYHMPVALHRKFMNFDTSIIPLGGKGWNKNVLVFALLAHYFSLDEDEQKNLLFSALEKLDDEKRTSGDPILNTVENNRLNTPSKIVDDTTMTLKELLGEEDELL